MASREPPQKRPQLDRSVLAEFRRRRITDAFASVCSELGYREVTIDDVVVAAHTSRNTVYELFANKEAILVAWLRRVREELQERAEAACRSSDGEAWGQVDAALDSVLRWVAEDPAAARVFLHEFESDGPEARDIQGGARDWFAEALRRRVPADPGHPPEIDEMIVGGIMSLLRFRVLDERAADAPALRPELVSFLRHAYGSA